MSGCKRPGVRSQDLMGCFVVSEVRISAAKLAMVLSPGESHCPIIIK